MTRDDTWAPTGRVGGVLAANATMASRELSHLGIFVRAKRLFPGRRAEQGASQAAINARAARDAHVPWPRSFLARDPSTSWRATTAGGLGWPRPARRA